MFRTSVRSFEQNIMKANRCVDPPKRGWRWLAVGSFFFLLPTVVKAQEVPRIKVETLLESASEKSPLLRARRALADEAKGLRRGAWARWLPYMSARGEGRWNAVEAELDLRDIALGLAPALGIDPTDALDSLPPPTEIQPRWVAQGVLRIRQLIFDPRALYGPSIAAEGIEAQQAALEAARRDVLFSVLRLAVGLESLDALETAASRAVTVATKRARDARLRVEAGTAIPLDESRAIAARTEAESERQAIRAERVRFVADLKALSGWSGPLALRPVAEPTGLVDDGDGVESRPLLKQAAAVVRGAEGQVALTRRLWLPSIAAEGQASYASFGGFANEKLQGTAFVSIALPLFDASRYAEADVARANADRARASLAATRARLRAEEEKARASLGAARSRLELAHAQLDAAQATVDQVERRYREGEATSLDLQTADSERFGADRALAERKLAVTLAELELARALGGQIRFSPTVKEDTP